MSRKIFAGDGGGSEGIFVLEDVAETEGVADTEDDSEALEDEDAVDVGVVDPKGDADFITHANP